MFSFIRSIGESVEWLLNLIGVAAYFWMLFAFLAARRRYNRRCRLLESRTSPGGIAIAIGIGLNIENDVKVFLKNHYGECIDIDSPIPLLLSYQRTGLLSPQKMRTVALDIASDLHELRSNINITAIHLFYGGPYVLAITLGSMLANWVPVHLYTRNLQQGTYEYAFTIDGSLLKGDGA